MFDWDAGVMWNDMMKQVMLYSAMGDLSECANGAL
jgi:hypothetical protein